MDQVEEDVGDFVADVGGQGRVGPVFAGLFWGEPLEEGDELADFAGEGHDEVLRVVERFPVAGGGEVAEALGERVESHGRLRTTAVTVG